jgi:hypothetical protein
VTLKDVTDLINALLSDTSRSSSYILFPSVGVLPGDLGGLAALAESTEAVVTGESSSYDGSKQRWRHSWTATGASLSFTGFSFGVILARFRLPSGLLEEIPGPLLIQPPRFRRRYRPPTAGP